VTRAELLKRLALISSAGLAAFGLALAARRVRLEDASDEDVLRALHVVEVARRGRADGRSTRLLKPRQAHALARLRRQLADEIAAQQREGRIAP